MYICQVIDSWTDGLLGCPDEESQQLQQRLHLLFVPSALIEKSSEEHRACLIKVVISLLINLYV